MIGQVIKTSDFETKLFIAEFEKNYTTNKIKFSTYKKDFNDYILELYKKILILNKYRKINQNIISFGSSFNCSSKREINFPFIIPNKFEVENIKIYFDCEKFQYNKINTTALTKNLKSKNNESFQFDSFTFLQEPPRDELGNINWEEANKSDDWKYLFLSRKSISSYLFPSGAGSGQSFGVNQFSTVESSYDYLYRENYWEHLEERTKPLIEWEEFNTGSVSNDNSYHKHKYMFASENHTHYLQPTAHFHNFQIPSHNHNYPSHVHGFRTPEHAHELDFSHGHDVENEFYQSSTIGNITIKINNNLVVDKKINGEVEFENYINSGINILSFICDSKCFLNFTIVAKGRIKI